MNRLPPPGWLAAVLLALALPAGDLPGAGIPHGLPATESDCTRCHDTQEFATIHGDQVHQEGSWRLEGEHAQLRCKACHDVETGFANLSAECSICHLARDAHRRLVGDDCASCHDPRGWVPNRFRHVRTGFPLTGAHRAASCDQCHAIGFPVVPRDCVYCHQIDFLRESRSEHTPEAMMDCELCHNTLDWDHVRLPH